MKKKTQANNKNRHIPKRRKSMTVLFIAVILILICAVTAAAMNLAVIKSAEDYIVTPEEASTLGADAILVLGARVYEDGNMCAMLTDRVIVGTELYKAGAAPKLLMSGDHGTEGYDEVFSMKKYAVDAGIPSSDVFCDHAGFSTYESLYRARDIFQCRKIIVVTQKFHISRAIYLGRKLGLEVYGVTSDRAAYSSAAKNALRESAARIKAVIWGVFKPEPTYLGEAIPISGDGNVTDDRKIT